MVDKLVVGPISQGLRTGVTPFNIDNDSFPTLINAYQWRGRVKRKRGTSLLCRLQRFFASINPTYTSTTTLTLDGTGTGNLITGFSLQTNSPNASIVPGSVVITGVFVYTDPMADGILYVGPVPGFGTINYATGSFTIPGEAGNSVVAQFRYYPTLPVMGLEDLVLNPNTLPGTMAFDTVYSYLIQRVTPFAAYDVSFYKNPAASVLFPNYVPKSIWTTLTWNGQDYQQFWTTNYQGALWATNGVNVPFTIANIGMQYKFITGVTIVAAAPPAQADITIVAHGLVQGDFIFVNEVFFDPDTGIGLSGINFQTGYVISANPQAANVVRVEFPNATLGGAYTNSGIAQYLTSRSDTTKDCLRWFDGDPTNGNTTNPTLVQGRGWVNFMPPLSEQAYSIADLPAAQYYLVGAKMIIQLKDRLLALGAVVQSSAAGSQVYLQDTIIFSDNGTPYYTCSFTGEPSLSTTIFHPVLVPINQTAIAPAWWEDQTGFGGFLTAGVNDAITTASSNEDVLIVGFTGFQTRLIYSGDDVTPFNFYYINSELGSSSTFSGINMDKGSITKGDRGYILTTQVSSERIDMQIPDQVFEIKLSDNANERITAQRDFINEWIYFTYPGNQSSYVFPNQTLLYNYRDDSYAIFNEAYTTYGEFKKASGLTWATVGASLTLPRWSSWNTPWNSGTSTVLQPDVIAGNQQGFVMDRDDRSISATGEGKSLAIQSITGNTVTSPNHCLNNLDFIVITGALGTVSTQVNNLIFRVYDATTNTFKLDPTFVAGTYTGGGLITRMYVPFIQTKQFPLAWDGGLKTRLGAQMYLLSRTPNGQITVQIYLSQNDQFPYNSGTIVPAITPKNNGLIYSSTVFTSPEKFINRVNSISIGNIGDGVTLTYNLNFITQFGLDGTIVPGSVHIVVSSVAGFVDTGLGTFNVAGTGVSAGSSIDYLTGEIVLVFSVAPLNLSSFANFQYFTVNIISPLQSSQDQIWHRMSTSLLGDTVQLGFTLSEEQMRDTSFSNQFTEIELHGMVLEVSKSGVLC